MRPIELAKAICREKGINFEQKLIEHLSSEFGAVVSRPDLFAMGRVVELPVVSDQWSVVSGRSAWHIEMAVGNLQKLIGLLPFHLPFISFTRWKGAERLRIYPTAKFLTWVGRLSRPPNRVSRAVCNNNEPERDTPVGGRDSRPTPAFFL